MRETYDFSESARNPYAEQSLEQVTVWLDDETIAYFRSMAEEKGVPYERLISSYLRDCAERRRE